MLLLDPRFVFTSRLLERQKLKNQLDEIDAELWEIDERQWLDIYLYQRSNYNGKNVDFWFARVKVLQSLIEGKSFDTQVEDQYITLNIKIGAVNDYKAYSKDQLNEAVYQRAKEKIMNMRQFGLAKAHSAKV